MPIQRIPRYQLLLQDLVNSTRRNHKDYKHLRQALEAIIQIAKYINEQKRTYEEMQKVIKLQEEFSDNWVSSVPQLGFFHSHNAISYISLSLLTTK
jgi:hypothetical protein